MKTKNILPVVGALISTLSLTSCVVDVPVPMGGGPIIQQGGSLPPGYDGHQGFNQNNGFNPNRGYRPPQGGGYHGGNPGYNQGPNTGPPVYHGSQRQHVYGNGPQSYAQWGQPPPIRYNGGF